MFIGGDWGTTSLRLILCDATSVLDRRVGFGVSDSTLSPAAQFTALTASWRAAEALVEAGIRAIEVPLNSPTPFDSVRLLASRYGDTCLCGAGTVLSPEGVDQAHRAGARLIVSPNTNRAVIARAVALKLTMISGFATATEAFQAIDAGASMLKLFPAATYGTNHIKAVREVLPSEIGLFAVGGVGAGSLASWIAAGVQGFGIGGDLYRPGRSATEVGRRAAVLVAEYCAALEADPSVSHL